MHRLCIVKLRIGDISSCASAVQARSYWNKRSKVPRTPPTKPLSFDYSGDLTLSIGNIDYSKPKFGCANLPELESASDDVKKAVSLEFSTQSEVVDTVIAELREKIKDHPHDVKPLEFHIAKDTVLIRNQIRHCLKFRNDKVSKSMLIERIHKRNKDLRKLQRRDIEKFNWLTHELQVGFMPEAQKKLSKREVREKAARDATEALIAQKTEQLRSRLAAEKEKFEEYKKAELANIENSLKELGIEMKTFEQTLTDLGFSELIPKPEPWVSLEDRVKQRKIAQLMELKKKTDAEILRAHGFVVPKSLLS